MCKCYQEIFLSLEDSQLLWIKTNSSPFIDQISVSKGSGSVVKFKYESMVGQINVNLKQPENADKFHFNFYLNQAGRNEYNTYYKMDFSKSWSTTFLAHFEDQSRINDRNVTDF